MKKQLLGIGVAIGMASLISLFTAHRIEAQYSSPVKVVNTTSAPVLGSSINEPGRIPYQATITNNACSGNACTFFTPSVPAGSRLVVQQIGVTLQYNGTPKVIDVELASNQQFLGGFTPPATGVFTELYQPVTAFIDGGHALSVTATVNGSGIGFGSGTPQAVIVTGYLLDCTAALGAPLAP